MFLSLIIASIYSKDLCIAGKGRRKVNRSECQKSSCFTVTLYPIRVSNLSLKA
jgi:hypothetical protein